MSESAPSFLPYFVASILALAGVVGVLFWSGALQLARWQLSEGTAVVGDADIVPDVKSQDACFKLCNNAYVAATFTSGVPSGYNCQLFRSVSCGYKNASSTTKFNPRTVNNDPGTPCQQQPTRR